MENIEQDKVHFVIDLETLDTEPTAAIISIGVAAMTVDFGIIDVTYVNIDRKYWVNGTVSGDTIAWWMSQSEEARKIVLEPTGEDVNLLDALDVVEDFMMEHCRDPENRIVWGNGPSFDNAMMRNAHARCGVDLPWSHRNERCVRTICDASGVNWKDYAEFVTFTKGSKVAHSSAYDAELEAIGVRIALTVIGDAVKPDCMNN